MVHRESHPNGYTLIELLVVLAIVAVLTVAGSMYMSPQSRMNSAVKSTTNTLFGALGEARALARSTGQPVALLTTGTGRNLTLTYGPATFDASGNPTGIAASAPTGSFTMSGDNAAAAAYAQVDDGDNQLSAMGVSPTLKSALQNIKASSASSTVFSTALWTNTLFAAGGTTQTVYVFYPSGLVNQDFHVAIVGVRGGAPAPTGPVAEILVTSAGAIYRYYKVTANDNTVTWKRL